MITFDRYHVHANFIFRKRRLVFSPQFVEWRFFSPRSYRYTFFFPFALLLRILFIRAIIYRNHAPTLLFHWRNFAPNDETNKSSANGRFPVFVLRDNCCLRNSPSLRSLTTLDTVLIIAVLSIQLVFTRQPSFGLCQPRYSKSAIKCNRRQNASNTFCASDLFLYKLTVENNNIAIW